MKVRFCPSGTIWLVAQTKKEKREMYEFIVEHGGEDRGMSSHRKPKSFRLLFSSREDMHIAGLLAGSRYKDGPEIGITCEEEPYELRCLDED